MKIQIALGVKLSIYQKQNAALLATFRVPLVGFLETAEDLYGKMDPQTLDYEVSVETVSVQNESTTVRPEEYGKKRVLSKGLQYETSKKSTGRRVTYALAYQMDRTHQDAFSQLDLPSMLIIGNL